MKRSALFLLLLAAPAGAQPQLARIGAAAAVRGRVEAVAPVSGAVGRVMESGKPVYLKDKVSTDAGGRMQVILLDETVFTIGPNTTMVMDEFVYDPATGAGKVSAQVTKGVFRFVTGKVARNAPSNMKVKLPVGVIGIRGTMVAGKADSNSSLVVLLGPGASNNAGEAPGKVGVANQGTEVELSKPGFGSTMEAGKEPSPPFEVPPGQMAELNAALAPAPEDSPSGGGGAAPGGSDEESASEASGQETAAAGESVASTGETAAMSEELSAETATASQDAAESAAGIADGIAKWDDVRSRTETGSVSYGGSGGFTTLTTAGGSPCSGSCSGSWDYSVYVDFANRSVSGTSNISAPSITVSNHVVTHNFTSDAGGSPASFDCAGANYSFNFTFLNSGGQAATQMTEGHQQHLLRGDRHRQRHHHDRFGRPAVIRL